MKPHEFTAAVLGIAPGYAQKILGGYCRPDPNPDTERKAKAIARDYEKRLNRMIKSMRRKYR